MDGPLSHTWRPVDAFSFLPFPPPCSAFLCFGDILLRKIRNSLQIAASWIASVKHTFLAVMCWVIARWKPASFFSTNVSYLSLSLSLSAAYIHSRLQQSPLPISHLPGAWGTTSVRRVGVFLRIDFTCRVRSARRPPTHVRLFQLRIIFC